MRLTTGYPDAATTEKLDRFLREGGLSYDRSCDYTVCVFDDDDGSLIATGSLSGNILKCFRVDDYRQGEGLSATLMTELRYESARRGINHLFVYTKPQNETIFTSLGFYRIEGTRDVLLMENITGGPKRFINSIEAFPEDKINGAVVCNCNPFTLGHRYLIETASRECDNVYVFVVSENKSIFPADVRLDLVRKGTADLRNVRVFPGGDYMISSATFPDYFMRDDQKERLADIQCELDLRIFCRYFAGPLHISRRYVGTEPGSPVTARYNETMHRVLEAEGMKVEEIRRRKTDAGYISASKVREFLRRGELEAAYGMLPATTADYLRSTQGRELLRTAFPDANY
ncbi:MAG: [Oscillospiraceae bacterium]|nr:[citrate (pro-3S)-lyase] ligase [Oscillospiraceae bacterium]